MLWYGLLSVFRIFGPGNYLKQFHSKKYSGHAALWEHSVLGKKWKDTETFSIRWKLIFNGLFLHLKKTNNTTVHSCKNNHVQIFGDQDWEDLQNSGLEVYASP